MGGAVSENVDTARGNGRPNWVPLALYVGLAFAFGLLLILLQHSLDLDAQFAALPQLSPALALLTTWLLLRRDTSELLARPADEGPAFARRFGIAVLVMAGIAAVTYGLAVLGNALPTGLTYTGGMFVALLLFQLIGALCEEVGWRGFLQPVLQERFGFILGAVITGVIWAAWHMERLLTPAMFVGFALTAVAISLGMAAFTGGSLWQRTLVAGLLHWSINISLFVFADPTKALAGDQAAMLPMSVPPLVFGAVGLTVLLVGRRRARAGS